MTHRAPPFDREGFGRRASREALARAEDIVAHDDAPWSLDAVVPPVFQSSLFTFASFAEMVETYAGRRERAVYTRVGNPTVAAFEAKLAALEGAGAALGLASGMAAISAAVLGVVRPGDRMVSVRHVYPDAFRFFETFLRDFGVTIDYVDGTDLDAMARRLEGARLLYLESPTSWTFETLDVAALARLARDAGAVSVIDNSWATPVFQRPLALGVDIVVHSASKYLGGHSDVVAGALAGSAERVAAVRSRLLPYLGAKLAPFEAWLLLRGLRTLPARLERIEAGAFELATALVAREGVARVLHPGLDRASGAPLERLPPGLEGCTGLFAVELEARVDIERFCDALRLFRLGVSWGGHESLACPAEVTRVQAAEPNPALFFDVPPRLVRLSVGLESVASQRADLERALAAGLRTRAVPPEEETA